MEVCFFLLLKNTWRDGKLRYGGIFKKKKIHWELKVKGKRYIKKHVESMAGQHGNKIMKSLGNKELTQVKE